MIQLQETLCQVFPPEEDYEAVLWRALVIVGVSLTAATLFIVALRR